MRGAASPVDQSRWIPALVFGGVPILAVIAYGFVDLNRLSLVESIVFAIFPPAICVVAAVIGATRVVGTRRAALAWGLAGAVAYYGWTVFAIAFSDFFQIR